jgi:membrane protein YdbS with pleckstrin-like domain
MSNVGDYYNRVIRTSRWSYVLYYLMVLVVVGVIAYIKIFDLRLERYVFIAALVFCLVIIKATEVHRFSHYYLLGDHALEKVEGILFKKHKRMKYGSISQLHFVQDPFSRVLGIGTIEVAQFSETVRTLIKNVNKPKDILNAISRRVHHGE